MTANRFLIVSKIENEFHQLIVDDLQKAQDFPLKVSTGEGKAAVTWIAERYAENLVSLRVSR